MAILTYIGGGYPQAGLWPKTTWDQAKAVSHLAWFADTVHPRTGTSSVPERYVDGEDPPAGGEGEGRTVFEGVLARDRRECSRAAKFVWGNQFTVVDGYSGGLLRWAQSLRVAGEGAQELHATW
jgi:glutathione S-transferase